MLNLPINNAARPHSEVRADVIRINQSFIDRIYRAHQSIAGSRYPKGTQPSWYVSAKQTLDEIEADIDVLENGQTDIMRAYLSRATDNGTGHRENMRKIKEVLADYRYEVTLAQGSTFGTQSEDLLRPTGRGFVRRIDQNTRISSEDQTVPVFQRARGLAGWFGVREIIGNAHQRVVTSYDNSGRVRSTQIYSHDCFGRPYME